MYRATAEGNECVLGSVQDQRRNADGRQHVPDVDLLVHPMERFQRPRARAEADHLHERVGLGAVEPAKRIDRGSRLLTWTENPQVVIDFALVLGFRPSPGVIRRPHPARKRAPEDERRRPLWVRSREHETHRRPLGRAVDRSAA
jgi:hypothetical protein